MSAIDLSAPDYPAGAPCWVDLLVGDVPRAQAFYSAVFGWEWRAGDELSGGYRLALREGHPVAGISRRPDHAPVPSQWTTYLRVDEIEALLPTLTAFGGQPLGRPVSLGALARTLVARDPGGTFFGLWQPGSLGGSGLLDSPGALAWNELLTRSYDEVRVFQSAVLGHAFDDQSDEGEPRWSVASTSDGNPAYGLAEIGDEWPSKISSHWVVSFATQNVVLSVAVALDHGATLLQGPFEGPFGLGAVLSGPEGEIFSVLVPED
ncbi:MAG: VOC family protein [Terracoccus sp.]